MITNGRTDLIRLALVDKELFFGQSNFVFLNNVLEAYSGDLKSGHLKSGNI